MDSDSDVGYNSFVELRGTSDFDAGYLVSVVVVALFVVDYFNFISRTHTIIMPLLYMLIALAPLFL